MAPKDVTIQNERQVWQTLYGKHLTKIQKRSNLHEGDRVHLTERMRPYKKGYFPQWTEEVFAVKKVVPGPVLTYKIEELDGTPLKGTFYKQDLQKVFIDDETMWRVKKVLKRRGKQALVRWKGWPSKYDSWIPRSDLTSTMEETYITLPSNGGGVEFHAVNKNNSFNVKLPKHLRLSGNSWQVGLASISFSS